MQSGPEMMRTYLFCIAALVACGDNDTDKEQRALDRGELRGQELAARARVVLGTATDDLAEIAIAAGIVSTANTGEIAQADIVLSSSADDDVRELASEIRLAHEANESELQALLADLGIEPMETAVSTALAQDAMMGAAQLEADDSEEVNFDYVDMQIAMHQAVLLTVDAVRDEMNDDEMQDFLSETAAAIREHRDHAGSVIDDL
jgi:predicted outer membrane protein